MTVLTVPAAIALAISCNIPAPVAPVIVGIARHESGLNIEAINHNTNGIVDAGLAQARAAQPAGEHAVARQPRAAERLQSGRR